MTNKTGRFTLEDKLWSTGTNWCLDMEHNMDCMWFDRDELSELRDMINKALDEKPKNNPPKI